MTAKALDSRTVEWFARRLRRSERAHKNDALECKSLGLPSGARDAEGKALTMGLFADITLHEARALARGKKKP